MGTYEFKCKKCSDIKEVQCYYDDIEKNTPECCNEKMEKIISKSNINSGCLDINNVAK